MSMVNQPKDPQPTLRGELWKLTCNLVTLAGQCTWLVLQLTFVVLGAVAALLTGVVRGSKHRR